MWSCGVILYTLLCNSLPFDADNIPELYKQIKKGQYNEPGYLSSGSKDLLGRMLAVSPANRISIPEIREHRWFKVNLPVGLLEAKVEASHEEVLEEIQLVVLSTTIPAASGPKSRHATIVAASRSNGSRRGLARIESACRAVVWQV